MIPSANPTSPTRLTMNAFLAASAAARFGTRSRSASSSTARPAPRPANTSSQVFASTSRSIENMNRLR